MTTRTPGVQGASVSISMRGAGRGPRKPSKYSCILVEVATSLSLLAFSHGQVTATAPVIALAQPAGAHAQAGSGPANANPPLVLTLQDALAGARNNNPEYKAAQLDAAVAHEDKVQARSALLPSVSYNTQYLYTEGTGRPDLAPSGRFIANNGVHEYIAQGNAHQVFSATDVADYRRAAALEAAARARATVAARGLVATVVQAYYGLVVSERKYATAKQAAAEGQHFFGTTQKLERGGEVAHSDVIKANIQYSQVERDLREAQLAMDRARLDLAVLVFPTFNQNFTVVDDLRLMAPLPGFDEVTQMATRANPQLRAALAALQAAGQEVVAARTGYLPSLALDYFYGIDANQFAVHSRLIVPTVPGAFTAFEQRNLGYAASASLQLPVWNWGATRSKVKQAVLRRQQAQVELSAAQRKLLADLRSFYNEAQTARLEGESLAQSADLAAESLRLTNLRYQAGEATVLEVVDAQNTSTQARNAYDDGQARLGLAVANLQTLTGSF